MELIVLQCGAPTPVVNASLWGVVDASQVDPVVRRAWGARLGWQGLAQGDWVDLTHFENRTPPYLETLPGAALGSGRYRLGDEDIPGTLGHLQTHAISAVLVIGGNGAMAAAHKLQQAATAAGYAVHGRPLQVIGIPKTIDNDLPGTDFTPGYGSAARFIAQTVRDVGLDLWAMRNFDDVVVLETMGRHVGWLAAAAALARQQPGDAPHLILVPEEPVNEEAFLARVVQTHERHGVCLVVASEGVRDAAGRFLALKNQPDHALDRDDMGQILLSFAAGVAPYLAGLVRERLKLRCRQIHPSLIQRASSATASRLDRTQAARAGAAAVEAAVSGASGVMVGLVRHPDGWTTELVPLAQVVGRERALPPSFLAQDGMDVTAAFCDYAWPLVAPLELGSVHF